MYTFLCKHIMEAIKPADCAQQEEREAGGTDFFGSALCTLEEALTIYRPR